MRAVRAPFIDCSAAESLFPWLFNVKCSSTGAFASLGYESFDSYSSHGEERDDVHGGKVFGRGWAYVPGAQS